MATCPRAARWRRARTGIGAAAAFRLRSRCTRRSSTADRERAMLLRCSRADADELANARVTEADASARAAALELELDTAREDSPNPRKPSPSYTPPPTHPARTRTSRGPPTAQDPPARCVTPLALFLHLSFARVSLLPLRYPYVRTRSSGRTAIVCGKQEVRERRETARVAPRGYRVGTVGGGRVCACARNG